MEMIRTRENTENQGDDTHGGTDLDLVGHFYHETTSEDGRSLLSDGCVDSLHFAMFSGEIFSNEL